MTHMRQVTKDEFEVLTRFHPGEVRYYVDVAKALCRNKGTKVVSVKPAVQGIKGRRAPLQHVQLTTKGTNGMNANTLRYRGYRAVARILNNDPTKVMTRRDLTAAFCKALPNLNKKSQVVPTISGLIQTGQLRYTGTLANGA